MDARDAGRIREGGEMIEIKPCTCHPDDLPPSPCARKYALDECRKAASQPVAWRVECKWADPAVDQTWRKYGDYGTLKSAESSQQRFANPGDIELRIIPLYPERALREVRLAVLRDIRAAIPANMASDKPYRPVNLGWSQCAETMRQIIDAAMRKEDKK